MAPAQGVTWPYFIMRRSFEAIAQAKISSSAWEAFDLGYLRPGDGVTMNRESLIYAAKQVALGMLEAGWQTPAPAKVKVMGRDGIGNFRGLLDNMRQGDFISDHDRYLAEQGGLRAVAAARWTSTPRWTSSTCSTWSARRSWRSAARPRPSSGCRPC